MEISIMSETDSRVLVYPLIKCLYNYGTIALLTSNAMMSRLIENELEGGFKNVRVIVDVNADLEAAKEADGDFHRTKYDFIIYDNMGAIDYDLLITVVTNRITDQYVNDILYCIDDERTHIIKMGTPAQRPKAEKAPKQPKPKKGEVAPVTPETVVDTLNEGEGDEEFNKWVTIKTEEDILREKLQDRKAVWCKFPSWDDIEKMEARGQMLTPDDSFIKEMHRLFEKWVNVDQRMFLKGARVKDESSSNFSGTDVW